MGKAFDPIFTVFSLIIGLGVVALALSFYSPVKDVEDSVFDCTKLDGAAQMKCIHVASGPFSRAFGTNPV